MLKTREDLLVPDYLDRFEGILWAKFSFNLAPGQYMFDIYQSMPDVLETSDNILLQKSCFNSDYNYVVYKEISRDRLLSQ